MLGWPIVTKAEATILENKDRVRLLCEGGKGTHMPKPAGLTNVDMEAMLVAGDIAQALGDQESTSSLDFLESRKKV